VNAPTENVHLRSEDDDHRKSSILLLLDGVMYHYILKVPSVYTPEWTRSTSSVYIQKTMYSRSVNIQYDILTIESRRNINT
jgi:hypothetical protein